MVVRTVEAKKIELGTSQLGAVDSLLKEISPYCNSLATRVTNALSSS